MKFCNSVDHAPNFLQDLCIPLYETWVDQVQLDRSNKAITTVGSRTEDKNGFSG